MVICAKTAEAIEMLFGFWVGWESCIRWGPDHTTERSNFGGRGAHWKVYGLSVVSCAKRLNQSWCRLGSWVGWIQEPRIGWWFRSSIGSPRYARRLSDVSSAKTAEPIEMPFEIPFGLWTWVGQKNRVLDEVHIPVRKGRF